MPQSTYMFKHYSDKLRQQPQTTQEREERDRDFGGFSNNQFYRETIKKHFSKNHPQSPRDSDDRYTVRQAYNLIDESDTQMEDLNIRLSFMHELKLAKALKIQTAKAVVSSGVKSAGAYAGMVLGGGVGTMVAGPAGTLMGGIAGATVGGFFGKKVYKNAERELGKKMGWNKTAKGIYPSTKDIGASIASAYLGADIDAKEFKNSVEGHAKKGLNKSIISGELKIILKVLKYLPLSDLYKIGYERNKAKKPLSINKQGKIVDLFEQLEDVLNKEYENVQLPISRLSPTDDGIAPSITSAIKEFQNYKMPFETKITLAVIKDKYESAKKFIASNRVLIAKLSPVDESDFSTGAIANRELIAKDQADKEAKVKEEMKATALKDGYEGDSLGETSSNRWNTPL
ncbi:hypothetical protein [Rouxiella sp. WC2420]|uniref:Glycine zipper domain-containing protein n=1 Tax=Rouxiella sp. WC2420 TaxID=3234145 RepID=A0AB39VYR1_9GAMM